MRVVMEFELDEGDLDHLGNDISIPKQAGSLRVEFMADKVNRILELSERLEIDVFDLVRAFCPAPQAGAGWLMEEPPLGQ